MKKLLLLMSLCLIIMAVLTVIMYRRQCDSLPPNGY